MCVIKGQHGLMTYLNQDSERRSSDKGVGLEDHWEVLLPGLAAAEILPSVLMGQGRTVIAAWARGQEGGGEREGQAGDNVTFSYNTQSTEDPDLSLFPPSDPHGRSLLTKSKWKSWVTEVLWM